MWKYESKVVKNIRQIITKVEANYLRCVLKIFYRASLKELGLRKLLKFAVFQLFLCFFVKFFSLHLITTYKRKTMSGQIFLKVLFDMRYPMFL